ncbi:MAG: hypothetical protein J6S50_05675 [Oscillospiraceae bacterium]|nr:hypothetical protein [Lachnospiraceae bacterium]MBO7727984.1 hypothetical protein [Oscillospiraceae bacterium]
MRDSMTFFQSYYKALKSLPPGNEREELVFALLDYMFSDVEPTDLNNWQQAIFEACRANIEISISNVEHGKQGGRPRKQNPPLSISETPLSEIKNPPFEESETGVLKIKKHKTRQDKTRLDEDKTRLDKEKARFDDPEIQSAWADFVEMRKAKGKKMTAHAEDLMERKLRKMAEDMFGNVNVSTAVEILNQSTRNAWTDIYELKKPDTKRNILDEIKNA